MGQQVGVDIQPGVLDHGAVAPEVVGQVTLAEPQAPGQHAGAVHEVLCLGLPQQFLRPLQGGKETAFPDLPRCNMARTVSSASRPSAATAERLTSPCP